MCWGRSSRRTNIQIRRYDFVVVVVVVVVAVVVTTTYYTR